MREGFHRVELNKTIWEVSKRYDNLTPVGSGAYGQVRPVTFSTVSSLCLKINITGIRNVDPEPYYWRPLNRIQKSKIVRKIAKKY